MAEDVSDSAARHTRGPLRLNLLWYQGRLVCEVEDTESADPVCSTAGLDAEGGRGTELIDMLADAWGSKRTVTGRTVWFELTGGERLSPRSETPW
ncbi:ATP-binding protein [Streptomyces collinus]